MPSVVVVCRVKKERQGQAMMPLLWVPSLTLQMFHPLTGAALPSPSIFPALHLGAALCFSESLSAYMWLT